MKRVEEQIAREAVFGILPVLPGERRYGFLDAFLVLTGYCIATWSYTQGAYLTSLVGFKQLLIGAFFGAILMLAVYQLPVILSVRYGIDIWIWLRSVFGLRGVKWISLLIIAINFPWYAVCCDLFASSMENLAGLYGLSLPPSAAGIGLRFGRNLDRLPRNRDDHLDHADSGACPSGSGRHCDGGWI